MANTELIKRLAAASQLVASTSPAAPSPKPTPLVAGLAATFMHLLSQLRHAVTSLSLAFKPPATADAMAQQLVKLVEVWGQLGACVLAASGVLGAEWAAGVRAVGDNVVVLLDVMCDGLEHGVKGEKGKEEYLSRTGMVWDAVDRMKDGSATEVQAVLLRWDRDRETVKDAWTEFKEMLEDAEDVEDGDNAEAGGFDDDDEWAELEAAMGTSKMTRQEQTRAEGAKTLLGLHQVLHPSLSRYVPLLSTSPEITFTPLLDASAALLSAFDNAVSSLYPTQDEAVIDAAFDELAERSRAVLAEVRRRLDAATDGDDRRKACRTFVGQWEARAAGELESWRGRRFDMTELQNSL
ncbi:hypothetical protein Q5752_000812 [Cryptotrichosporon argae]